MRTVALIPLRGGSKSIPYKNITSFAGKPLCYWTCLAASKADSIDAVYVSTEDQKIKEVVKALGLGIEVIDRPVEFAQDDSSTESVMKHFMETVPDFDVLVTLQATSPQTQASHIDEAHALFRDKGFDSLLTAVRVKRFFWKEEGMPYNYDYKKRPRRQEFSGTLMENGAFYITKKGILEREGNRLGGKIGIYEMPAYTATEIDEPSDWDELERRSK